MKKVLLLGASGLVAPHVIPGLESDYELRLADIKPHPDGKPVTTVDITVYRRQRVLKAGAPAALHGQREPRPREGAFSGKR